MSKDYTVDWPPKGPNENYDNDLRWSYNQVPEGDEIATSTWVKVSGSAAKGAEQVAPRTTKLWVTGGVIGEICLFRNTIVTQQGRTYTQDVRLPIVDK